MSNMATYVIRLPQEGGAREAIVQGGRELVEQHGGQITSQSIEDEMALSEMFEKRLGQGDANEPRAEAAALDRAREKEASQHE